MIEPTLVTLLNPLLAGGLYPNIAPHGAPRPYGVYTEIVSLAHNTLSDGQTIQHSEFQIAVWDVTSIGSKTAGESIASTLAAAFLAGTLTGAQISRRSIYEPETVLYGTIYEYSIWYH